MFDRKDKEEGFQRGRLWRAYRTAKRAGARNRLVGKKRGRVVLISTRLAAPLVENPGKAIAGVLAVAAVLGLGIWGGLALRRKRRSTYRSPYESRKFRRPLTDAGGYEAMGI